MSDYQYPDSGDSRTTADKNLGQKLSNASHWLRLLLMFLMYVILFTVVQIIVTVTMLVQWVLVMFKGETNARLRGFTKGLNAYSWEILEYLNFNSERRPFPLSDWPETGD